MYRIDLTTLRLFVAVAAEHSLTAAAEREHMALAAVSKRIRDLEIRLDAELLYRRPRGVELTPAGDALLHHARGVLEAMHELQADLSEYSRGVRGHVRMYANTSSIIEFLPADLAAFSRRHPEVKIDLQERISSEVVQAVREGRTDIGLFAGRQAVEDLDVRPYRCDRLVLVTPSDHPLARREAVSLEQAVAYDFIGLQQDASLHQMIVTAARDAGLPLRMRVQVRSFEGICRMIGFGMGVGVLPDKAFDTLGPRLGLSIVPLSDVWATRQLWLAVRDINSLSVLAREMVDHLTAD
ncbi:LysR family transcriptional regulator [Salinisphaera sp. T31B1]|uniref:LysR family transcriptional regulator n=1 Tax=Salinisphaera sp. T31B1 TaxID=727963 RepID=UPI003340251E